ncbi:alpha/beta hydrolase [Spirochaetia bacterium]|nr:alpha/beta hydrolase [Spirochaetia bacterium]
MINTITKVPLGGFPQKIHVLGTRPENPLLLFLHGGPGITNRHSVIKKQADLCDAFTIVAWDQRGNGGSYRGLDPKTLTVDRLVEDARELVEYLCAAYHKQKLFICGGSWGTELGTLLAYRYPEHIAAYVGSGQVVNGVENETLSYQFSLEQAEAAGDNKSVAVLKKYGPPVKGQYKNGFEGLMAQRRIMKKYGGHSTKKGGYFSTMVLPMICSGEYTPADLYGIIKGYKLVLSAMWPILTDYDFPTQCNTFKMPYYIFQGRLDRNTPSALVQGFYDRITAPDKDLVWFEHSAHGPLGEEPEKFKALLREKLLKIAA